MLHKLISRMNEDFWPELQDPTPSAEEFKNLWNPPCGVFEVYSPIAPESVHEC